jgi:hypothetical protein
MWAAPEAVRRGRSDDGQRVRDGTAKDTDAVM